MFVLQFCMPSRDGRLFKQMLSLKPSVEGTFLAQLSHKTQHTAWPKTFLPESISTHYIKHIKQWALRSTQL